MSAGVVLVAIVVLRFVISHRGSAPPSPAARACGPSEANGGLARSVRRRSSFRRARDPQPRLVARRCRSTWEPVGCVTARASRRGSRSCGHRHRPRALAGPHDLRAGPSGLRGFAPGPCYRPACRGHWSASSDCWCVVVVWCLRNDSDSADARDQSDVSPAFLEDRRS